MLFKVIKEVQIVFVSNFYNWLRHFHLNELVKLETGRGGATETDTPAGIKGSGSKMDSVGEMKK